jgi:hypothetical protein
MNSRFNLIKSFKIRPETTRKRHLRNAIYLTISLTLLLIFFTSQALIQAGTERSAELLSKKIESVEITFMRNFDMLENDMRLISKWGQTGIFDLHNDLRELDNKIIPIIEEYQFIISFSIISSDSSYYNLIREESGWQSFKARIENGNWEYFARPDSNYVPDEDFMDMIHSGTLYSIVFVSETSSDEPTIGSSHPITDSRAGSSKMIYFENDQTNNLALFNIDTDYIENDISNFKISEHGQVYLIPRYNYSYKDDFDEESEIISDTIVGSQDFDRTKILELAYESWYNVDAEEPFMFRYHGETWWGMATLPPESQMSRWLMVTLPSNELFVELDRERTTMIFFTVIILIVGGLLFGILVKLYNRPLTGMSGTLELTESEALLQLLKEGESDHLEFKSTLRWNLKSDKPDQNIEKSILKTLVAYLNSEGGTLLVGVEDDGNILGIESDKFVNEDKYMLHLNNMIKQHIGLEFAKYIHYRLVPVQDTKVLQIDCNKSNEPVFLSYLEDEDFYIRVGPASRKLSTKKALRFLMSKNNNG